MPAKKHARSYKTSNYWVILEEGMLSLRIDRDDPALRQLHTKQKARSSAIISPYNPDGKRVSDSQNRKAEQVFIREIRAQWIYYEAYGASPLSKTKAEKSFLILGVTHKQAVELGKKYKQKAIVFCHQDKTGTVPKLIFCH